MNIFSPNETWTSREELNGKKKNGRKKWNNKKRCLTGGCCISQASNMSLIEADA